MSLTLTLSPPFSTSTAYTESPASSHLFTNPNIIRLKSFPSPPFHASRRIRLNFYFNQGTRYLVNGSRDWSRSISPEFDDDDEEEDRSLDLFVKFAKNVFRKISKQARKSVRGVLPTSIPSELVGFSVNGVLMLAFLWVLKAFLEVVCTLGSIVFVSILLVRGIWTGVTHMQQSHDQRVIRESGVTYMQESRDQRISDLIDGENTWSGAQPTA